MTLEDFYFISQIAAALGIMASLVFVGVQIRQNTRATKTAAAEAAHRALVEWQLSTTPERAAIAVKANADFDSLTKEERFLMGTAGTALLLDMQEAHAKWLEGSLVESRWRAWDQYASFSVSPAILRLWGQRRSMFSDAFQAFYDDKIANTHSAQPLHSYNFVYQEGPSPPTGSSEAEPVNPAAQDESA
ncbi:MAG: hypothetical protein ABJP48_04170 [Erythrobacter sp.]